MEKGAKPDEEKGEQSDEQDAREVQAQVRETIGRL